MFGYVRADLSKLNEADREIYRAAYCTLCNSIKQNYGALSRAFLNYDITFLALLLLHMQQQEPETDLKYCPYRAKQCPVLQHQEALFSYCAAVLMILAYEKMLDNVRDERFLKKLFFLVLSRFWRRKYRKVRRQYPELCDKVRQNMILQTRYETENAALDRLAQPTADSLGLIFEHGSDSANRELLYRFGYLFGRWIYFTDAADDLKKDVRSGAFNPFKNAYTTARIEQILNYSVGEAAQAFAALGKSAYSSIIENIIYEGTLRIQQKVLEGEIK